MGLIKAALGAAGGVLGDQWKEFFYCEAMTPTVLVTKGVNRVGSRGTNTKGDSNIISDGSVVAVADGQCAIIVDQGKVVELCAMPGDYVYDSKTEPSLFVGSLSESIPGVFKSMLQRVGFGGGTGKDQRVYYFNTKELMGNKYGTPSPIAFRVVDNNIGLDMDISIRCFGEYSYRIANPILFYTNVCGNVSGEYTRDAIDSQLKSELLTALQPAFAQISAMGVRYSALGGYTKEIAKALNAELSADWIEKRGIEIVNFGVSQVKALEEDEAMIKELQRTAVFRNANMAAAQLVGAQSDAMKMAAGNTATGPALAFMNMNMAANAGGMNAGNLFAMGQQQQMQQMQQQMMQQQPGFGQVQPGQQGFPQPGLGQPAAPAPQGGGEGWTCGCGAANLGKFCQECGAKKPAGAAQYRCDKCGWQPAPGGQPPKFCPECGDGFDNQDIVG